MPVKQERFKITLKEDFDQNLLAHVEEVFHGENLLQAVIYGHLLLERALNSLIAQRMKRPEVLEGKVFGRWTFLQKLGLYVALYDPSEEQQRLLLGFNQLRNAMAHGLESTDRVVRKYLPWKGPSPPHDARQHVWTATANLFFELGIVHGIEHVESTYGQVLNLDLHAEPALPFPRLGSASDDRAKSFHEGVGKDKSMEVQFRHPRTSLLLIADVSPQCSGEQALAGLLSDYGEGPFLSSPGSGEPYELYLRRTETNITPHMTFEEAGVVDGDLIDVLLPMTGAGSLTHVEEHETDQTVELHFMHPRSSRTVIADVSPQCSGEEALMALLSDYGEGSFLSSPVPGEAYELFVHRTNTYVAPYTTFKQAGAINGDLIDIKISPHGSASHKRGSP